MSGKILYSYRNGNSLVIIREDGTREIMTEDDEFKFYYPLNIDLKVTNKCLVGNCAFCHEASSPAGLEAPLENFEFLKSWKTHGEVACLDGESVVYGENGAIEIKDLKVGDKVYDKDYILRTVSNIQVENKQSYLLKGNKGFTVICSEDHPFIVNEELAEAITLQNKSIDLLIPVNDNINNEYIIDMAEFVHKATPNLKGSVGGAIKDDMVRITNSCKWIPRYIPLTKDLMWLYGLYISQGSSKGLAIHISKEDQRDKIIRIWKKTTGLDSHVYLNGRNAMSIELNSKGVAEAMFKGAFKSGTGARNKSLSCLFSIEDKELIRNALWGLWQGDGCIRRRHRGKGTHYILSFKTSSKKLAYELIYILKKYFGISASKHYGVNKKRKIEGRMLEPTDYYQIEISNRRDISKLFGEFIDLNPVIINSAVPVDNIKIQSIEKLDVRPLYDITLDSGSHIFPVNGYVLTHNCGGGQLTSYSHLDELLQLIKDCELLANATFHDKEIINDFDRIKKYQEDGLLHGIGVSLHNPSDKLAECINSLDNVVIHIINGIFTEEHLNWIKANIKNPKLLILAYKHFRKGNDYYDVMSKTVDKNQEWLYNRLPRLIHEMNVVSFDNAAINQLDVKRLLTDEEYEEFYQGDETVGSFYVDAVNGVFAPNSVHTSRETIMHDIHDMFMRAKELYRNSIQ